MFKTPQNRGKVVGDLGKGCEPNKRVFTVVEFSPNLFVGKTVGFRQVFSYVLRVVTHNKNRILLSVNGLVLPNFHKTYNNLLLFNKLVFCNRSIV